MNCLIASLLFFLWTSVAMALDYDVEVLIFERSNADTQPPEPEPPGMSEWGIERHLSRIASLASNAVEIESLVSDALEHEAEPDLVHLDPVVRNLKLSGYPILQAVRWTQPGNIYQYSPLVSLGTPENTLLHAYIRIYKTSGIHADVDVRMTPSAFAPLVENDQSDLQPDPGVPGIEIVETDPLPPQYFISEKRRLKFEEVHYLDHPKFGVILGVWPAELKKDPNVDPTVEL